METGHPFTNHSVYWVNDHIWQWVHTLSMRSCLRIVLSGIDDHVAHWIVNWTHTRESSFDLCDNGLSERKQREECSIIRELGLLSQ